MPQTAHCMPFDTHSNTLVCVLMLVYVFLIDWLVWMSIVSMNINFFTAFYFCCSPSACFICIVVHSVYFLSTATLLSPSSFRTPLFLTTTTKPQCQLNVPLHPR
ncbi:hypothetical protein BDV38DRAFT_195619 [Aspergillus pseudotamarii]|uniref:Uncharacterized protein n=1 Tax=Aspergillus pseudotamarii TaxID=132259 RepID=A0A5N6SGS2_ASPPS|nr:uncharacterized protein BDV38DRAFT_195619 [Aspergillus pseudotamarii]KAE8133079.1 hypothetical protein BDV38DRAFT_195619 [Aspergillus pseudotamarii]